MVDVVSIVIAVISLVGSIISAGFTAWVTYYIDEVKRRAEAKKLTNKYRDPLTLSAYDLQSRLFGLLESGLLSYLHDEERRELVQLYTAYLVGQYFSWVYIFRRQAQFLRFSTDKTNQQLTRIMDRITAEFALDSRPEEGPFMLWRGQQGAIGEIMTMMEDAGQLYCIGYAGFAAKYKTDEEFRKWFEPIARGVVEMSEASAAGRREAGHRLRRLQHLLIDLVVLLGSDLVNSGQYRRSKVDGAPQCGCNACPGTKVAQAVMRKETV